MARQGADAHALKCETLGGLGNAGVCVRGVPTSKLAGTWDCCCVCCLASWEGPGVPTRVRGSAIAMRPPVRCALSWRMQGPSLLAPLRLPLPALLVVLLLLLGPRAGPCAAPLTPCSRRAGLFRGGSRTGRLLVKVDEQAVHREARQCQPGCPTAMPSQLASLTRPVRPHIPATAADHKHSRALPRGRHWTGSRAVSWYHQGPQVV